MNNTSVYDYAPGKNGQSSPRRVNISLAAAAWIVVVLAAVILFAVLSPHGENSYGAAHIQVSSTERPLQQTTTARAMNQTPLTTMQTTATAIIRSATETTQAIMANATPQPTVSTPTDFTLPPYQPALIPLEVGVSVEGSVGGDEPAYYYVIQGKAGDYLAVTVSSPDRVSTDFFFQSLPQAGGRTNSAGSVFHSEEMSTKQTATIPVFVDSAIIFSVHNKTGDSPATYSIEFGKIDIPQLTYGETLVINTFDPFRRPPFPYIYCDFVGQRGDIVDIVVETETEDTALLLREFGDGRLLASDDDSGAGHNPEISRFQLPADGTYSIEVEPVGYFGRLIVGEFFKITVSKREPIELVPNEDLIVRLYNKNTAQVLSFEGQAGQTVALSVEPIDNMTLTSFSIEQNGRVLDQMTVYPVSGGATSEVQPLVREITIPADGTVSIFVNADVATANQEGAWFRSAFLVTLRNLVTESDQPDLDQTSGVG